MLTWTLTICTYNRPHFLTETLRHALAQTRRPTEIIVVDASDDWKANEERMLRDHGDALGDIHWVYVPATVRSLTFQRNQALELARSDIVFSLDDDIYLYPDAAEIIMAGYDADTAEEISMIAGQFTMGAFKSEGAPSARFEPENPSFKQRVRRWVEDRLSLDGHFVPYDRPLQRTPVPSSIQHMNVFPSGLINGGRTTFRRKFGVQNKWSELLRYYATHEDSDFSYRMSRFGRLIVAPDAGFFHADGNESTVSRFRINTIRVRNLMALHAIHSPSKMRSAISLAGSFLKFALMYVPIDATQRRFSFPTVRAYLYGLVQIPVFLFWPFDDISAWYTQLQERMYGMRYK